MHELAAHPLVEDPLQRAKLSAKLDGYAQTEAGFDEPLEGIPIARRPGVLTASTRSNGHERDEKGALTSFCVPKQRRVLHALTDALHCAIVCPAEPMADDEQRRRALREAHRHL